MLKRSRDQFRFSLPAIIAINCESPTRRCAKRKRNLSDTTKPIVANRSWGHYSPLHMTNVTVIMNAIDTGAARSEDLLPLVYDELRRLAAVQMQHEAAALQSALWTSAVVS